jgi:hypothetical protein
MSRQQLKDSSQNFKTSDDDAWRSIGTVAAELLSVIVLAMTCPDPAVGMELLGEGVGVVLGGAERGPAPPEPTELLPLRD